MSTAIGAIAPVIKRSGTLLSADWMEKLTSMRISREVGLVGRATLRFTDSGYSLSASDTFALGTKVTLAVPDADDLFKGTVTGINLDQSASELPELVVVIDDDGYKLGRGTRVTTFLNTTYDEVIRKMAQHHTMKVETADTGGSQLEYLMQAGTDLEFLNSIVERTGCVWYVETNGALVIKKIALGSPAATLALRDELREFSVRASGLRPTELKVNGWNPAQQENIVGQNPATASSESPNLIGKYVGSGPSSSLTAASASVAQLSPLTQSEANAIAGSLYNDWASAAVVARGTADINSAIKPGVTVKIKQAGPASGNYLVTGVEHIYDSGGFVTKFTAGSHRPSGLVDTLGSAPADPGFLIGSLVVGVVSQNDDPDNTGRIKVQYKGINGEIESPWARVVTLGGGHARGVVFQPEVNDEVLVAFERGDTRRPVVIGGLYSKKNTLPTGSKYVAAGGTVDYRRITSRKNHMIEMADGTEPTEQHILLQLGTASHTLRLGADAFAIKMASGKPVSIQAGDAKFEITAAGDITMEANNITIKAKVALKMQGGTQAELKGTQTAIQGTQVQVKADGVGSVEAGGPLTLKGAIVGIN
ncbi:MAG: phage baseplate assembly protein V [Actinomycetota bacterium]|nr:phage baseplate assembly protein V [Actinomycetota bacterium]